MPSYLYLPDVNGTSGNPNYPGWTAIKSWNFQRSDYTRSTSLDFVMDFNKSSHEIMNACATGKQFSYGTIVVTTKDGSPTMQMYFSEIVIASYSHNSGGDLVSMIYSTHSHEYFDHAARYSEGY